MKTLILCHGNINRSPMCAAVMRCYAGSLLDIRSAGFVNPGRRAAKKMRDLAEERGYDLSEHRSQLATRELMLKHDVIIYMDGGNYRRLKDLLNGSLTDKQVYCLGAFANPPVERIPDPAFMSRGSSELLATVDLIEEASRRAALFLIGQPMA